MKQGKIKGVAVAVITATLLLGAVDTSSAKPVRSDATPTARETLGPNALKKLCVKTGLRMPQMPGRELRRQREKQIGQQGWFIASRNYLLPAVCNGKYLRIMSMRREVQDPVRPRRWYKAEPPYLKWYPLMSGNKGIGDKNDPNFVPLFKYDNNDFSVAIDTAYDLDIPKRYQSMLYRCAPGPRKNRARVKIRNQVKDLRTGKIIRSKVRKYPVRVHPAC